MTVNTKVVESEQNCLTPTTPSEKIDFESISLKKLTWNSPSYEKFWTPTPEIFGIFS